MRAYKDSSGEIVAVFKSSIDGKHYNIYRRCPNGEFKVIGNHTYRSREEAERQMDKLAAYSEKRYRLIDYNGRI